MPCPHISQFLYSRVVVQVPSAVSIDSQGFWFDLVDCVELEQEEALRYLRGWLQQHPSYGSLVPGGVAKGLNPSEVSNGSGAN